MSDQPTPESLPTSGGWAPKPKTSPGATPNQVDASASPAAENAPAPDCWGSKPAQSPGATDGQTADGTDTTNASLHSERFASFGALLSAFIASSWCWLPPLLIVGGISGAGMMTFMAEYRPIFMTVTFAFLAAAFYLTYRPGRATRNLAAARVMSFNKIMLWGVTVVAVGFLCFPQVTDLFASSDGFTADMTRTVIQIEGMTWHTWSSKAEQAIKTAPGVLAVKIDYEKRQATIGTKQGTSVPKARILAALEKVNFRGDFAEPIKANEE